MIGYLLLLALSAFDARANLPSGLSLNTQEWEKLKSDGFYARAIATQKSTWPEMQIFAFIKAGALESASLFHALDIQKNYVPQVLESRPIKHVSATDVHTAYTYDAPWPMSDIKYVHGTKIAVNEIGPRVDWYLVQSETTEDVNGFAQFRDIGDGRSLLEYHAFVLPKSFFAGMVKKVAFKNTQRDIQTIVKFIEETVSAKSHLVAKYKDFYLRALKGEMVYEETIAKEKKK